MPQLPPWRPAHHPAGRLGRVPAEVKAQILAAKQPALDRWALRVLTAPSLQAVFGATKARPTRAASARRTATSRT